MVLKSHVPVHPSFIPLIESLLPLKFGLKHIPLHRYKTLQELFRLSLTMDEHSLKNEIARSPTCHGVMYGGEVYVHPDSLLEFLKIKWAKKLRKEFKSVFGNRRRACL